MNNTAAAKGLWYIYGILGLGIILGGIALHLKERIDIFPNLQTVEHYAQALLENPKPDNNDWENPDFTTYYKNNKYSKIYIALDYIGLYTTGWSQFGFKKLLDEVIRIREKFGYYGNFIQKIYPQEDSTFIIIGDLYGAFHSLVRDLRELTTRKILDTNFVLQQPHHYIVINGNFIARSPHSLETLTLIMRLIERNPNNVIVILGQHEAQHHWQHYTIKNALRSYTGWFNLIPEDIPYSDDMERFFNTLPRIFYISGGNHTVRIGNTTYEQQDTDDMNYIDFLTDPTTKIWKLTDKKQKSTRTIDTKATIHGPELLHKPGDDLQGLELGEKIGGMTSWIAISSPTESSQMLFKAFHDSFIVLQTREGTKDWTLDLYSQDIRIKNGFEHIATFDIFTGQRVDAKKYEADAINKQLAYHAARIKQLNTEQQVVVQCPTLTTTQQLKIKLGIDDFDREIMHVAAQPIGIINIGATMDLSHSLYQLARQVKKGIELAVNSINEHGGVHGKKVDYRAIDDQYDGATARAAAKQLLNTYKASIFLTSTGTPTIRSFIDLIEKKKILLLFPFTGASLLHSAKYPYIINFRASYEEETEVLTRYAVENLGAKRIAFFYQREVPCIGAARAYMQKNGLHDVIESTYEPQSVNFETQVAEIEKFSPDALILLAIPTAALELIRQYGAQKLIGKQILCWSDLTGSAFQKSMRDKGLEVIVSSTVPDPINSTLPIVQQCRAEVAKAGAIMDAHILEGYINAKIMADIMQHIADPTDKDMIVSYAESLKDYTFGGLKLSFDKIDRSLSSTVWLDTGKKAWVPIDISSTSSAEQAGDTKKVLRIGTSLDLSRGAKFAGTAWKNTLDVVFERANKKHMVPGYTIALTTLDDEYTPKKTRENVELLLKKYNTDIIFGSHGSACFEAYMDLVDNGAIAAIFPWPGIAGKLSKKIHNMLLFRPSFYSEAEALTTYMVEHTEAQNIAIFYQADAFGEAALQGAMAILAKRPSITVTKLPYERNDTNYTSQVKEINAKKPDIIMLFATAIAGKRFLQNLDENTIRAKQFYCISDLAQNTFSAYVKEKGIATVIASAVPNPKTDTRQLVVDYRKLMHKNGLQIDTTSLECYMYASCFIDALSRIRGPLTKNSIIDYLESIKAYDFQGIPLNFDPQTRTLLQYIWLNTGTDPWLQVSLTKQE